MGTVSNFSPDEINSQIENHQASGKLIRDTPVMAQWPWSNGIPLEQGSLADAVRRNIDGQWIGSVFGDATVGFATRLDVSDPECFDHWERDFLWEYLGGPPAAEPINAPQHIGNLHKWGLWGSPRKMEYTAQYILRYRVLDILMDVMEATPHPQLTSLPRRPLPSGTTRMDKIHKSLANWRQCITKFESMLDGHDRRSRQTLDGGDVGTIGTSHKLLDWPDSEMRGAMVHPVQSPGPEDQGVGMSNISDSMNSDGFFPYESGMTLSPLPLLEMDDIHPSAPYLGANFGSWLTVHNQSSVSRARVSSPGYIINAGVLNLLSAQKHHAEAAMHKVLMNFELVAFALSWFAMGEMTFPETSSALIDSLSKRMRAHNITAPVDFSALMGGSIRKEFIQELKTTFNYAAFVSPLLLLMPKKYGAGHPSLNIMAYAASLGNDRPPALRETERALWNAIVHIAYGMPTLDALRAFSRSYHNSLRRSGEIGDAVFWFREEVSLARSPTPTLLSSLIRHAPRSVSGTSLPLDPSLESSPSPSASIPVSPPTLPSVPLSPSPFLSIPLSPSPSRPSSPLFPPSGPFSPSESGLFSPSTLPSGSSFSAVGQAPGSDTFVDFSPASSRSHSPSHEPPSPRSSQPSPGSQSGTIPSHPPLPAASLAGRPPSLAPHGETSLMMTEDALRQPEENGEEGRDDRPQSSMVPLPPDAPSGGKTNTDGDVGPLTLTEDVPSDLPARSPREESLPPDAPSGGKTNTHDDVIPLTFTEDVSSDLPARSPHGESLPPDAPCGKTNTLDEVVPLTLTDDVSSDLPARSPHEESCQGDIVPLAMTKVSSDLPAPPQHEKMSQGGHDDKSEDDEDMIDIEGSLFPDSVVHETNRGEEAGDEEEEAEGEKDQDGNNTQIEMSIDPLSPLSAIDSEQSGVDDIPGDLDVVRRSDRIKDRDLKNPPPDTHEDTSTSVKKRSKKRKQGKSTKGADHSQKKTQEEKSIIPVRSDAPECQQLDYIAVMHWGPELHATDLVKNLTWAPYSARIVQLSLYDDESFEPEKYSFRAHKSTSDLEMDYLEQIDRCVRSRFVDFSPKIHASGARDVDFDPMESCIFVVDHSKFMTMDAHVIQQIFRYRHILVVNVPAEDMKFDLNGLSRVGSLSRVLEIQVGALRNTKQPHKMNKWGTLPDLYAETRRPEPAILNALDLPLGGMSHDPPPRFDCLASHERAWQECRGREPYLFSNSLADDLAWATAATKHATSWMHVDDDGLGTAVTVKTGAKYWVVGRPLNNLVVGDNMDFGLEWRTDRPPENYHMEGVLLRPGTVFYMRPCTPHYVITIDHAITFGRSFYSSSTIWQSVIGIIQTFVMDGGLTNAIHENLRTLLRRIMHMWSDAARQKTPQPAVEPHLPDWSTCDGIHDTLALGGLIQMQHVVNRQYYLGQMSPSDMKEDVAARLAYLLLIRQLESQYVVCLHGTPIPLMALADRFFIFLAAGSVKMKEKLHALVPKVEGCTYTRFKSEVGAHVREHFHWLYARYRSLLKLDNFRFLWSEYGISVETRDKKRRGVQGDLGYLDDYMFGRYGIVDSDEEDGESEKDKDDGESEVDEHNMEAEEGDDQNDGGEKKYNVEAKMSEVLQESDMDGIEASDDRGDGGGQRSDVQVSKRPRNGDESSSPPRIKRKHA